MTRERVDLPEPFSPVSAWTSPARIEKSTRSSATTPGYTTVAPRTSTSAGSTDEFVTVSPTACISQFPFPTVPFPRGGLHLGSILDSLPLCGAECLKLFRRRYKRQPRLSHF